MLTGLVATETGVDQDLAVAHADQKRLERQDDFAIRGRVMRPQPTVSLDRIGIAVDEQIGRRIDEGEDLHNPCDGDRPHLPMLDVLAFHFWYGTGLRSATTGDLKAARRRNHLSAR